MKIGQNTQAEVLREECFYLLCSRSENRAHGSKKRPVRIAPMGPRREDFGKEGRPGKPRSRGKGFVCPKWNGKPLRVLHRSVAKPDILFEMITVAAGWRMGFGSAREVGKQSQLLDCTEHLSGHCIILA